jgi:hypothetical protein
MLRKQETTHPVAGQTYLTCSEIQSNCSLQLLLFHVPRRKLENIITNRRKLRCDVNEQQLPKVSLKMVGSSTNHA